MVRHLTSPKTLDLISSENDVLRSTPHTMVENCADSDLIVETKRVHHVSNPFEFRWFLTFDHV